MMKRLLDNADFLHLFSEETNGLKYLTHDFRECTDYVEYIYKCQKLILDYRENKDIQSDIYELVRGFVFGPLWVDYNGVKHTCFAASEEFVKYAESVGKHPLTNPKFEMEFEDFRNSIRFRSSRLNKFIQGLCEEYPKMQLEVDRSLKGADLYINTGAIRKAIRLIIETMQEFKKSPSVVIGYSETPLGDYIKSTITIEHKNSFPVHTFTRDKDRLCLNNSGSLGTIKSLLAGICEWSIISKWDDIDNPIKWNILRSENDTEIENASICNGFTHVISIIHKP